MCEGNMAGKELEMSVMFFALLALSLVANTTFTFVILLRRRLHNGHFGLLLSLAVVDIAVSSVWACLSGVATGLGWDIPSEACHLQSYLLTLAQTLTAFTLAAVSLERLLKMLKPSRHALVFVSKVVFFLVAALWIFCGVVASIHLYGSVPVFWMREQRQCAAAFSENTELLNFTFCLDHAIPYWVVALPVLATCFAKIFISRRRSPGTGEIILERNSDAPGDSYSARLTNVQAKFSAKHSKLHPTRERKDAKKGSLGKRVYTPQGYVEPEQWDSDIEDGADVNTDGKPRRQRIYHLECPDYMMLRASAVTIFVTWLLWFPWVVARFVWNFTPYEDVPGWFEVLAVVCMHLSSFAKPVVYTLANPYFRGAVAKTVLCRRDMRLKP